MTLSRLSPACLDQLQGVRHAYEHRVDCRRATDNTLPESRRLHGSGPSTCPADSSRSRSRHCAFHRTTASPYPRFGDGPEWNSWTNVTIVVPEGTLDATVENTQSPRRARAEYRPRVICCGYGDHSYCPGVADLGRVARLTNKQLRDIIATLRCATGRLPVRTLGCTRSRRQSDVVHGKADLARAIASPCRKACG